MKLKNISLNYEDGGVKTIDVSDLNANIKSSLAESGLCEPVPGISSAKYYLLLQWNDGWKEVAAVNADSAELIRYYVIRRIEDRGRIALDVGAAYPELIAVERQPKEMCRITLVNDKTVRSYGLETEIERYEGIFEEGGKKEFKKFDRAENFFDGRFTDSEDAIKEIKNTVSGILKNMNVSPAELLNTAADLRPAKYKDIALAANIYGFNSQADLYGFIDLILNGLTGEKF